MHRLKKKKPKGIFSAKLMSGNAMIYVNEGIEKKNFFVFEALRLVLLLLSLENTYVPGVPVERMHNALLLQTSHFPHVREVFQNYPKYLI